MPWCVLRVLPVSPLLTPPPPPGTRRKSCPVSSWSGGAKVADMPGARLCLSLSQWGAGWLLLLTCLMRGRGCIAPCPPTWLPRPPSTHTPPSPVAGALPNKVVRSKLSELLEEVEGALVGAAEALWQRFAEHGPTQAAAERMLQVGRPPHALVCELASSVGRADGGRGGRQVGRGQAVGGMLTAPPSLNPEP